MYWSKINHTRCSKENKVLDTLSIVELDTVVSNFKIKIKIFLMRKIMHVYRKLPKKIWFRKLHFFSVFLPTVWILGIWNGLGGEKDSLSYLSLSSKTLLTNPHWPASLLSTFLAVKQSSLTKLWLPISFGKRCRAPTSAHKPLIGSKRNVQKVSFFYSLLKSLFLTFLR